MAEHRIRLTDSDIELLTAALAARHAGVGAEARRRIRRLIIRLDQCSAGNPNWTYCSIAGYDDALRLGQQLGNGDRDTIAERVAD